jgi:hypothetical protein
VRTRSHGRAVARTSLAVVVLAALAACSVTSAAPPSADGSSASGTPTADEVRFPDGVTSVECDLAEQAGSPHNTIAILADPTWKIGGWSHVNGVGSFATVAQPVGAYRISAENWQPDDSCAGAKTLATVLNKKTYDWDRQHANGMEASFPTEDLAFGDITDIVFVLRLDPELSHLPSSEELTAAYGDLLTEGEVARLDSGDVNLELTLFGEGATADQPFLNAGTIIAVDPAQAADGWVRVQVPRSALTFYTEDNYVRTEVGADEWSTLRVQGLRINPETAEGLTVRHFLQDGFDVKAKPELFKEMAITFALIEVGRS